MNRMDGVSVIVGKMHGVGEDVRKAKRVSLRTAGLHILGVSNEQVPIEEHDLEESGVVSQNDAGLTAISYDTAYAVKQHEDMSLHHDAGRNAKYLESAMNSEREAVLEILAAGIKKETGLD